MGIQTGVVRIRGTVGNLTFAKTANGDEVRIKTSLNKDKMLKDKRFKRTRENWAEFGRAGKAAKLIRNAFAIFTKPISDRLGYSRLMRETMKVVKSDTVNGRGQRLFTNGDLTNLINFEFNANQAMESTFKEPFELTIDRAAGTADIAIPDITPDTSIKELVGATHIKLVAAVVEIDWLNNTYTQDFVESVEIPQDNSPVAAQAFNLTFDPGTTKTILVAFGVWYYQEVNGTYYLLQDGSSSAMAIVGIDHV